MFSAGIFILVLHTASLAICADGCNEPMQSNLTCMFTEDKCGWKNVNNSEITVKWTREDSVILARMSAGSIAKNSRARIKSPLMCSTNAQVYLLRFKYRFTPESPCQLSVFLLTNNDTKFCPLWRNMTSGVQDPVWAEVTIDVAESFKLLFQAKKLGETSQYCAVRIHQIDFNSTTTPLEHTAVESQCFNESLPTDYTQTTTTNSRKSQEEDGLSTEGVVGIVIALLIITALVIFLFIFVRRRLVQGDNPLPGFMKCFTKSEQPDSIPANEPRAVNNYERTAGNIPAKAPNGKQTHNGTKIQQLANLYSLQHSSKPQRNPAGASLSPNGSNNTSTEDYYSMPRDEDSSLRNQGRLKKPNEKDPDYEISTIPDTDGPYNVPDDADWTGATGGTQGNLRVKIQDANDPGYNRISFDNPESIVSPEMDTDMYNRIQDQDALSKAPPDDPCYNRISFDDSQSSPSPEVVSDTYNHIQDQDNVYKVPRNDPVNEYSLATIPGGSDTHRPAVAAAKPQNKAAMKGETASGDGDYNQLKLKERPSASAGDPGGHGDTDGTYNHLKNQAHSGQRGNTRDEYNRINLASAAGVKPSLEGDGPYNHLS